VSEREREEKAVGGSDTISKGEGARNNFSPVLKVPR
jgi:hypothetical protein